MITSKQFVSRMRATARAAALSVLAADAAHRNWSRVALERPRIHFVYLHSVRPNEEENFRRLLRILAETHTFVSHSAALRLMAAPQVDRPYMAFSFDDGYASNVRTAQLLDDFGAKGCFFVCTDFIGTRSLSEARQFFRASELVDEAAMSWADIERLVEGGHEVGNHTRKHLNLRQLGVTELQDEIAGAGAVLEDRLGQMASHFAWPFGRFQHFSPVAAQVAHDSGVRSIASAERGAHCANVGGRASRGCIRRDHVQADWPIAHALYFLARSARNATSTSIDWPEGWDQRAAS